MTGVKEIQMEKLSFRKLPLLSVAAMLLPMTSSLNPAAAQPSPEGQPFQVNTFTPDWQGSPVVGSEGSDGFVVVWESALSPGGDSNWGVVARRYADGLPLGDDFQVNGYTSSSQVEPAVGADGAGGFVVAWRSYGSFGTDTSLSSVQARHFPNGGQPTGEFQVNTYTTGEQIYPAVARYGSGFVVVWASRESSDTDNDWGIRARLYSDDGSPAGDEFQVNTRITSVQAWPTVASTTGGGFVVAWESVGSPQGDPGRSILAQRFDLNGAPIDTEFQVNTFSTGDQVKPAVGSLDNGFVVVWTSEGSYGTDQDELSIQAQLFGEDGARVGSEFQVNTFTSDRQFYPAVNADDGGGFVVTWRSEGSSGTDLDDSSIQAQQYSAEGSPISGEFQVNRYTTARQAHPGIASDGAGGFVIAWRSDGSFGSDTQSASIQAQRYSVALFKDGFESGDTSAWSQTVP